MLKTMLNRTFLRSCLRSECFHGKAKKDIRQHSTTVFSVPKISKQTERWNAAIHEATELVQSEKVDENFISDANANRHIMKLLGSSHPTLQSVRQLLHNKQLSFQLHGVIALLVAKALGHTSESPNYEDSMQHDGITPNQRKLADALELHRAGFIVHTNICNLSKEKDGEICKTLQHSNGVGVLVGNYLSSNANVILGGIKDSKVAGIISTGMIDSTQSAFFGEVDRNGNCLPDPLSPLSLWQQKTFMSHASLLAKGCQAVAHLGGHGEAVQKKAHNYAKKMAIALKTHKDIQHFNGLFNCKSGIPFSLELAPVIMHLDQDPKLVQYILKNGREDINNLDFAKILIAVKNGRGPENSLSYLNAEISEGLETVTSLGGGSKASDLMIELLEALRIS